MTTTKLALTELANGQANYLNANAAFAALDQLVHMRVVDKDLSTPPGSPTNGAAYIVASSPTGVWSGKAGQIAYWLTSVAAWSFLVPGANDRWRAWVSDESLDYRWNGTGWGVESAATTSFAPVITEATTARTLALTDAGAYLRHTSASASTVTMPPQSSVAWANNTEVHIRRAAAGNLTLTPGAGVTLNAPSGGTLVMTDAMSVTLKRVGTDVWDVIGQTVAV